MSRCEKSNFYAKTLNNGRLHAHTNGLKWIKKSDDKEINEKNSRHQTDFHAQIQFRLGATNNVFESLYSVQQ